MLHNHAGFAFRQAEVAPPLDLVALHTDLVRRIARNIYAKMATTIEQEDLVQIGMVALLECVENYDDRGFAFATYASTRIRGAMIDQLRKVAPLSRSAMATRRSVMDARRRLEHIHQRPPTSREIAQHLGVEIPEYYLRLNSVAPVQMESIDAVYSDHDSRFADHAEGADDHIVAAQIAGRLGACLTELPERDAAILRLFFVEEWNLQQIGRSLGIGAARVCQIKKSALQKLRLQLEPAI